MELNLLPALQDDVTFPVIRFFIVFIFNSGSCYLYQMAAQNLVRMCKVKRKNYQLERCYRCTQRPLSDQIISFTPLIVRIVF